MKWIVISSCLLFTMFIGHVKCACIKHAFGRNCTTQCHCRTSHCDQRGMCPPPGDCEDGWGGIHCSYRDAALNKMNPLTDNDRTTCLDSFSKKLYRLPMREETKLTWIRFNLKKKNVFDDATISFEDSSGMTIIPTFLRKIADGYTVDVIGSLKQKFKYITIVFKSWANKQYVCGMFVSGGRNVAFKQPASLSSVWDGHVAARAVDGNRDPNSDHGYCIHTNFENTAYLDVYPRLPIDVNVIDIYNREHKPCKLKHFRLCLFTGIDSWDTQAQVHAERGREAKMVYTVQGTTFEPIRWIWLGVKEEYWGIDNDGIHSCEGGYYHVPYENVLTICEVEVYGEVMCTVGQYGYDCEKTCDSNCDWGCQVETGYCNKCPAGRSGKFCEIIETTESPEPSPANTGDEGRPCEPGVFGVNCTNQCHCRSGECTALGECILNEGCEDGWGGIHCSYRDAAFNEKSPLTDNSIDTCLNSSFQVYYWFRMREETKLTWIRFNLKKQKVFDNDDDVKISFEDSSRKTVIPTFLRRIDDGYTVDFIGSMDRKFKYIKIAFKYFFDKQYFCSMFVSGGRNVAFKQPVSLSSVWRDHVGRRAVDGVRDANLDNNHCASTQMADPAWLNLKPRNPIDVNFVEIYNSDFLQCRLKYFNLSLLSGLELNSSSTAQNHFDNITEPQMVYKVLSETFEPIRRIYLEVDRAIWRPTNNFMPSGCDKYPYPTVLTVCELEIYGDVKCPAGRYGYDCEKRCSWVCVSGCHVETGYCNKCPLWRTGKHCEIIDPAESFFPPFASLMPCSESSPNNATSQELFKPSPNHATSQDYCGRPAAILGQPYTITSTANVPPGVSVVWQLGRNIILYDSAIQDSNRYPELYTGSMTQLTFLKIRKIDESKVFHHIVNGKYAYSCTLQLCEKKNVTLEIGAVKMILDTDPSSHQYEDFHLDYAPDMTSATFCVYNLRPNSFIEIQESGYPRVQTTDSCVTLDITDQSPSRELTMTFKEFGGCERTGLYTLHLRPALPDELL